jgi:hypothetical protein
LLIEEAKLLLPRLQRIWADGGYAGKFVAWAKEQFDWTVEVVKKITAKEFVLLYPGAGL